MNWSNLRTEVHRAGRTRWGKGCQVGEDWFQSRIAAFDFWFIWKGQAVLQTKKREYSLKRGTCIWLRSGGEYLAVKQGAERLGVAFVHFDLVSADGRSMVGSPDLPDEVHEANDIGFFDRAMNRISKLANGGGYRTKPDRQMAMLQAESLLQSILIEIDLNSHHTAAQGSGIRRHHHLVVMEVTRQISQEPAQTSVEKLAARHGYSVEHFGRIFRSVMGVTPKFYLQKHRFQEARHLLLNTDYSIAQVADAVGYQDGFSFSKQFKKWEGVSPQKFRETGHSKRPSTRTESILLRVGREEK